MTDDKPPIEIPEIERTKLDPGDIILIRLHERQTAETIAAVQQTAQATFKDHQVVVLNGLDVEIVHPTPGELVQCPACGHAATWVASNRDEHNEPVDSCAYCGARLNNASTASSL